MGVHAPRSSSHVARLAGRGALTAAAALALTGGTASMAFAAQAPGVPTTHDIQGHATDGTHDLQDAAKASPLSKVPTQELPTHKVSAHDVAGSMKAHASEAGSKLPSTSKLPTTLPTSDMKTDAGHAVSNTRTDMTHAATNGAGAAKGGLTPTEASDQFVLMGNDVKHAADNGKADMTHWGEALGGAPQVGGVPSFT
jgi:hypothetical protein